MDLEDAAGQLYDLAPGDFTAGRAALVAQARGDGDKVLAKEIGALRRPTVTAWLVNRLAGQASDAGLDELESLGAQLREAQAGLDAVLMKQLGRRRQELVADLVRQAEGIAADGGQKLSQAVRRELEETFVAAIADERAGRAVTSGRLTRALAYAGFGEVDLSEATATALTERAPRPPASKTSRTPKTSATGRSRAGHDEEPALRERREREEAREKVARAREAVEEALTDEEAATADLDAANLQLDAAREEEGRLTDLLAELQQEIVRRRHEVDTVARSVTAAEREVARRRRQLESAQRARHQTEADLADLEALEAGTD